MLGGLTSVTITRGAGDAPTAAATRTATRFVAKFLGVGDGTLPAQGKIAESWGWVPQLSLVMAFGLVLVALAQVASAHNVDWAEASYWAGIATILFPVGVRIAWPKPARCEQLSLVILLGLALYAVKVLHSPTGFTHFDEFLHWRSALDVVERQRLFAPNSLLPISPHYPGLEIITSSLVELSGLSVFGAGTVLIAAARVIFVVALFLLFERLTASSRIAAIGCFVFMSNSNFAMFHAQFAYESLAISLLLLLLLAESGADDAGHRPFAHLAFGALLFAALALTHHLTSYFAAAFLLLLAVLELRRPTGRGERFKTGVIAAIAVVLAYTWPNLVGEPTAAYVGPVVEKGFKELSSLFGLSGSPRIPFVSEDGFKQPLWRQLAALLGLAFLCLGLATGFFRTLALAGVELGKGGRWLRPGIVWTNSRLFALALLTLAFPLTVVLRLTRSGWEIGNRLGTFVALGTAIMVAVAIVGFWQGRSSSRLRAGSVGLALGTMLLSGMILGWGPNAIVSHYRVSADAMSVEPLGIATAQWTRRWLGTGNRFATDRINRLLLAVYGRQMPVTLLGDGVDTSYVLFAPRLSAEEFDAVKRGMVDYVLVDLRLTEALPMMGVYFEGGEDEAIHEEPPGTAALLKFNALNEVGRPFDNGVAVIYDVRSLHAPD
jgi:hypothetical protein